MRASPGAGAQGCSGWDMEVPSSCMRRGRSHAEAAVPDVRQQSRLYHAAEAACWRDGGFQGWGVDVP